MKLRSAMVNAFCVMKVGRWMPKVTPLSLSLHCLPTCLEGDHSPHSLAVYEWLDGRNVYKCIYCSNCRLPKLSLAPTTYVLMTTSSERS